MTNGTYIDQLKQRLHTMEQDIAKARRQFEAAESKEKAVALGELSQLEVMHRELIQKIEEASAEDPETWSAAHRKYQEDADGLADTFERWFMKYT